MTSECAFFWAGERDVDVGFAGRDDAAGVQDFEGSLYRFECVDGFEGG